jgi:hypothetical protein
VYPAWFRPEVRFWHQSVKGAGAGLVVLCLQNCRLDLFNDGDGVGLPSLAYYTITENLQNGRKDRCFGQHRMGHKPLTGCPG